MDCSLVIGFFFLIDDATEENAQATEKLFLSGHATEADANATEADALATEVDPLALGPPCY